MRKVRTYDTVYNGDRWKVAGSRGIYFACARAVNGVPFWELYYAPTPKAKGVYVFGGLDSFFGAKLKEFYNASPVLRKVRTPKKDRVGPRLQLWGLVH